MEDFGNFGVGNFNDPGPVDQGPLPPDPDTMPETPQQVYGTPVYDQQPQEQMPQQALAPVPQQGARAPSPNAPIIMAAIGAAAGLALGAMLFRK